MSIANNANRNTEMSELTLEAQEQTTQSTMNPKLAGQYEAIRRREYELITGLLEVVPKIDGLGDDQVAQMRDALFHADHPYMMVFMGPFSAGKSSLINALLGEHDLLAIGATPTTDRINILRWGEEPSRNRSGEVDTIFYPSGLLQKVSFVDTPGLESVFEKHEDITRKFLHRSDTVLLVMLATQAMTKRNADYLQILKDYGKNVILVLNQVDLLSPEEVTTVRDYVVEQSRDQLGFKPEVWLTSARKAMQARLADGTLDEALWRESGLHQIEAYVDDQLSDLVRMRQKLTTPLHIVQNVHQAALASVRQNQAALDHYQSIAENIERQLEVAKREHERAVNEIVGEIDAKFDLAAGRGGNAIREQFQITRAFGSVLRGVLELVGLSRIARGGRGGSYTRAAFEAHQVFEPLREIPTTADKVGPRLEGRDIQDLDDLVKYARKEIGALPPLLQNKVIGTVQAPIKYDRTPLQTVRAELEPLEEASLRLETENIERALRNTLLYMAAYEVVIIVILVTMLVAFPPTGDSPLLPVVLVLIGLALIGLVFLPLRGRVLANTYHKQLDVLCQQYSEALTRAADKQIAYGMRVRRDVVSPLTRVIEAQTELHSDQLKRLQTTGQEIIRIEGDLAALGKGGILGLGGKR